MSDYRLRGQQMINPKTKTLGKFAQTLLTLHRAVELQNIGSHDADTVMQKALLLVANNRNHDEIAVTVGGKTLKLSITIRRE